MPLLDIKAIGPEQLERIFDIVIIGSGIAGAIIANELTAKGKHVLIVEAGPDSNKSFDGYIQLLNHFYKQPSKDNQSPFPPDPNAEMPRGGDLRKLAEGQTNDHAYIVQSGPYVSDSVYSRVFGGTTVHWEAKPRECCPRTSRHGVLWSGPGLADRLRHA